MKKYFAQIAKSSNKNSHEYILYINAYLDFDKNCYSFSTKTCLIEMTTSSNEKPGTSNSINNIHNQLLHLDVRSQNNTSSDNNLI